MTQPARSAIVAAIDYHRRRAMTEVVGTAFMTGTHQFVLEADDPLGPGITLE